jgi:hypothetical protein
MGLQDLSPPTTSLCVGLWNDGGRPTEEREGKTWVEDRWHCLIATNLIQNSNIKVKLSLCLTVYALRHEDVWGNGCIDPSFLDHGTSWRRVVSFTPRTLYPRGRSHRCPLDRRLDGPQSRYGRYGEVKILVPAGTWTPTPLSSNRCHSLYQLCCRGFRTVI